MFTKTNKFIYVYLAFYVFYSSLKLIHEFKYLDQKYE